MHKTRSNCVSTTVLVLAENELFIEVCTRSKCFHFKQKYFWIFMKKALQKEKSSQKLFWQIRKILNIFKNVLEKAQKFKSYLSRFRPFKTYFRPFKSTKIFCVGQPWRPTVFQDLRPPSPTILVLLQPWKIIQSYRVFTREMSNQVNTVFLYDATRL